LYLKRRSLGALISKPSTERSGGRGLLERREVEDATEEVVGQFGQPVSVNGHCL
jgi:hypothetical protein